MRKGIKKEHFLEEKEIKLQLLMHNLTAKNAKSLRRGRKETLRP